VKLIPRNAGNRSEGSRLRWFWQFLFGAVLGAIVGLLGYFVTGDVDWLAAIPMCGILFAVQPLNVLWYLKR
jgi:hypothetical protein